MAKTKTVVNSGAFNAAVIGGKSWEQFKAEADEQTKANSTAWFGAWGDLREGKLREVYDASVTAMPTPTIAEPIDTPPAPIVDNTPNSEVTVVANATKMRK